MIKPNELRIGNLIYNKTDQSDTIVWAINKGGINGVVSMYDSCDVAYDEYEPIPLTEEWLKRFGFVVHEDGIYTITHNRDLVIQLLLKDDEITYEFIVYESGAHVILNPIQHVHQLQNLYFALTGEELKCD